MSAGAGTIAGQHPWGKHWQDAAYQEDTGFKTGGWFQTTTAEITAKFSAGINYQFWKTIGFFEITCMLVSTSKGWEY